MSSSSSSTYKMTLTSENTTRVCIMSRVKCQAASATGSSWGQSTGRVKRLTSCGLLHGSFHVGGTHHHVAGRIQNDSLPWPLVQEQHLALPCHHVLLATPACLHILMQDQPVSLQSQQHDPSSAANRLQANVVHHMFGRRSVLRDD